MQIKERGKKVVCIKTEYVPEKKRTYGRQVASQDSCLSTVSDKVRRQLNQSDVDELQKWLDDRAKRRDDDMHKMYLSTIRYTLKSAVESLEAGFGEILDEKEAAAIWENIARLQKALKKAGHPRPRQPNRQPAKQAVDSDHADLFQSGEQPD